MKVEKIDIPVGYAAAFEGERVRKDDMHVQFGYKYSDAVEYVHMIDSATSKTVRSRLPAPILTPSLKAARCRWSSSPGGRGKMQPDFEGILERQIHRWLSHAMGFMHTGQRDQIWCRVSKKAFRGGAAIEAPGHDPPRQAA